MKRTTFHIVVVVVVVVESMTTHPHCCCHPIVGGSSIDTSHSRRELNTHLMRCSRFLESHTHHDENPEEEGLFCLVVVCLQQEEEELEKENDWSIPISILEVVGSIVDLAC